MTREENLLKLVTHINCLNPAPTTKSAEYIFLDTIFSDEMIDAALKLELRVPTYIDDYAKTLGKTVDETAKLVSDMAQIGLVEYMADENGVDRVYLPVFVPGSMELACMDYDRCDKNPAIAYAFPQYIQDLNKGFSRYFPMGNGICRALPVEKAVQNESKRVDLEEVSHWVNKYAPSLAVAPCECRHTRRMNGELGHELEDEWCISLGTFAESCIRTGKARRISVEECYEILHKAEEKGFVHELTNIYGKEESTFICNCHWSSCCALRTAWYCNTPNMIASNFRAHVDPGECVACGQCVEVCPNNAVRLGTKLCEKHTTEIKSAVIPGVPGYSEKDWKPTMLTEREYVVETGTAPCKTNCPAHIAIQGYIKLASQGKYREALELIKKENPLPAVCGSICNHRCEDACTRNSVDEAVAIDEIKKFIAEQDLKAETRFIPQKENARGYKVAVVGSGPAGLSCAYYLTILGHQVTVFEKEAKPGGMLTMGIPNFRLEKSVVDAEIDILRTMGVKFKVNAEVGRFVTLDELRTAGYKAFYVAIGLQGGGKLGVPGDDAEGVIAGIDFMKKVNLNGETALSGDVAVIGGGNIGADVARTAIRCGAKSVKLYCLEGYEEMPMGDADRSECEHEGIEIHAGWGQIEVRAVDGKCSGIKFRKCVSVKNAEGKFAPVFDDAKTEEAACGTVLFCIGNKPVCGNLLTGTKVKFSPRGMIETVPITDQETFQTAPAAGMPTENYHLPTPFEVYQTAEPDIFVGGDVYSGQKFAIDAIAAGKEAAESIHRFVWKGHSLVFGRDRKNLRELDKDNMDLSCYDNTPRQKPLKNARDTNTFHDPRVTLTEEQVKAETSRCLGCGAAHVDTSVCLGCGLCTTRCKFDAIHLTKDYDAWGMTYEDLIPAVGGIIAAEQQRAAQEGK